MEMMTKMGKKLRNWKGNWKRVVSCAVILALAFSVASLAQLGSGASTGTEIVQVEAGNSSAVVLLDDGTVWVAGDNPVGQLGLGYISSDEAPKKVPGLSDVSVIAAYNNNVLVLKNDGTVWSWGQNSSGQLGHGHTQAVLSPTQILGLSNVKYIEIGVYHSFAIQQDGTVWAWGSNSYGVLGDGTTTNSYSPVQATLFTNAEKVFAGLYATYLVKTDGTVWVIGNNTVGQLGLGHKNQVTTPTKNTSLTNTTKIQTNMGSSSSTTSFIALKSDGNVWAWGKNADGQLGNGTKNEILIPTRITSLSNVVDIAMGITHALAVKSDGTAWVWGGNGRFQFGNDYMDESTMPVQVNGITNAFAVSAGNSTSFFLLDDGTLYACGNNSNGRLGADWIGGDIAAPIQVFVFPEPDEPQLRVLVEEGTSLSLTALLVGEPGGLTFTWVSADPSIASVDQNGVVTGIELGVTKITVTSDQGDFIASCYVRVIEREELTELGLAIVLLPGESFRLETVGGEGDVTWESSDTVVAIVDPMSDTRIAKITAITQGVALITVKDSSDEVIDTIYVKVL